LQYAPGVKVRNAWRVLAINHFSLGSEIKLDHSHFGQLKIAFRSPYRTFTRPALTARYVRFADAYWFWAKTFQLIARRLSGNHQLTSRNIGRSAAHDDAGEFGF
jgi:hypothetical protein